MNERAKLLEALLDCRTPAEELLRRLATYPWDSEVLVHARPEHLLSVLRRFQAGSIGAAEVEEWANAIEMRDDIGFEAESEEVVRDVIHVLANPELAGPLTSTVTKDLMDRLARFFSR
jgi:hypothetical protein